jgi:DNA polymerase V
MGEVSEIQLNIKTTTTGFASPAESYVDKRLDLNELIIKNIHTTFYFKYKGPNTLGVKTNDVLVIDRETEPEENDLVVITDKSCFKIRKYEGQENVWGRVSWILQKL